MAEKKPDRSAVPDAEIIQLVLGGEIDAFDELVRRTRRPAYRLARRITRNHEDADDVVQDSYV
jgi:RNA polymerase sigma-70 factor (ECF subfamily)